jgi:hypothetical protein
MVRNSGPYGHHSVPPGPTNTRRQNGLQSRTLRTPFSSAGLNQYEEAEWSAIADPTYTIQFRRDEPIRVGRMVLRTPFSSAGPNQYEENGPQERTLRRPFSSAGTNQYE